MSNILDIYDSLLSGPKSIADLKILVGSHRSTIMNNIEILENLDLINEYREKNKRIIKIANYNIYKENKDTYFNLPITTKDKKVCHYLFSKIKEDWKHKNNHNPPRIAVQKIVTEIANALDLPIPRSWYLYGEITVCVYDENIPYECSSDEISEITDLDKLHQAYENVMEKYLKADGFSQFMEIQYAHSNNNFYLAKRKFDNVLLGPYTDNEVNLKRVDLAYKLLYTYPPVEEDTTVKELLEAFVSCYVTLILKNKIDEEMTKITCNTFKDVWDCIATHQFIRGLSTYYDKDLLNLYLTNQTVINYQKARDAISLYVNLTYY
jgi:hypothetical protein